MQCNFAHGTPQVRSQRHLPTKYKTKLCHKFNQNGCCPYGTRCQFVHRTSSQRRTPKQLGLDCLLHAPHSFFSFLELKENNTGRQHRLDFFRRVCDSMPSDRVI